MHIRGREVYALYYSIKRGDIYKCFVSYITNL